MSREKCFEDLLEWANPLVSEVFPELADELEQLLVAAKEDELARQIPQLKIVDRCRCGDDDCCTFYTEPPPKGSYGPGHRTM